MADYNNNRGGGNAEKKKPKAPVDWSKTSLSTPVPGVDNAWASMTFDVVGAAKQIRCTVWTNVPDDKENGNGKISTTFTLPAWFGLLTQLQQVINAKGEIKLAVAGLNWYGFGGKRSDQPRLETELFIGKDADGVMYILLTAPKRPKLVFHFDPKPAGGQFHEFRTNTGDVLDRAAVSLMYARGYHLMWSKIVELDMISELLRIAKPNEYEPPFVFGQNNAGGGGGGGGGGGQNRSGGGGGYQRGGNSGGGGASSYGDRRDGNSSNGGRSTVSTSNDIEDEIPY